MIQVVYGLPAEFDGYMGLVWTDRRNNTHTLPITQQLWAVILRSGCFTSVLSVFLLIATLLPRL